MSDVPTFRFQLSNKGRQRIGYDGLVIYPRRSVPTKTIVFKAYEWIFEVAIPHLDIWNFSMSEFIRSAVKEWIIHCDDRIYYIHKSRKMPRALKRSKSPFSFKMPTPAVDYLDNMVKDLCQHREDEKITRSDLIRASISWYDEEYWESMPIS